MSAGVKAVLEAIQKLDPGQQITVLRNTVVDMGFDSAIVSPREYPTTVDSMVERSEPAPTKITIEGIKEPTVLRYLQR